MDFQDGSDLTELITDKFTINSAGKTPQSRKNESFARKFSSKMLPQTLAFDEVDGDYGLPSSWHNSNFSQNVSISHKSPFKMEEETNFDMDSIMLNNSVDNIFCKNKLEDSFNLNVINSFNANKTPNKSSAFAIRSNSSPLKSIENTLCNGSSPLTVKKSFSWRSKSDITHLSINSQLISKLESPNSTIGKENVDPLNNSRLSRIETEKFPSFDLDNGKTPSKFSVVQNSLSRTCSSRSPKNLTESSLHDFTSRDSGFENSSSFADNQVKMSETVPDYCNDFQKLTTQFHGYEPDEPERHFETDIDFCEPSTSTSHFPSDPFSSIDDLQDLEVEFDSTYRPNELSCSKYEIISTDSPDICSASGKVGTIIARNFEFGSPIGECENSESFNIAPKLTRKMPPRSETTRMLNFDTETTATSFKFIPPKTLPPKKADTSSPCRYDFLKTYNFFSQTKSKMNISSPIATRKVGEKSPHIEKDDIFENKCVTKKMRADSGIESDIASLISPLRHIDDEATLCDEKSLKKNNSRMKNAKPSRLFSSSSIESGCITEMEECMFDIEENSQESDDDLSTVPSSLHSLISGEIKTDIGTTPNRPEGPLQEMNSSTGKPFLRRCFSLQTEEGIEKVRAALFRSPGKARKRSEGESEGIILPKRRRSQILQNIVEMPAVRPLLHRTISDNEATIKMSLARAYTEPNLIGDFSRPFCLPLEDSQHQDLKSISSDTLAALIDGEFKDKVASFQVIDCRYPYEFEGGHIVGAQNLYTEDSVNDTLLTPFSLKTSSPQSADVARNIVIFHCEFSSERGPKLCRFLRRADRAMNQDSYPSLLHPELYLLLGGYRQFHARHGRHCRPIAGGYTPMSDPRHAPDLRRHRAVASRRAFQ